MISAIFLDKVRGIFEKFEDIEELNRNLKEKTGIFNFVPSTPELEDFKQFLKLYQPQSERNRDLGDFQTPSHLTDMICKYILDSGFNPNIIVEPTCGTGNFIISSLKIFPKLKYIYCIEMQKKYEWVFKLNVLQLAFERELNVDIEFQRDNIFTHSFSDKFLKTLNTAAQKILVLGNPPWVTNTELSVLKSDNVPLKSNIKGVSGIEALTGKGNFDIAEYIILQMIQAFSNRKGKIAMLCKTSVIKNILKSMLKMNLKLANIQSLIIDAKKEFNIHVDAGLFVADLGRDGKGVCTASSLYNPSAPIKTFGWVDDKFVSNINQYLKYRYLEGQSSIVWRQGVKHDAAKVMVLTINNGIMSNGLQEQVLVEEDLLYPFIKSSDLKLKVIKENNKRIIITQSSLKEETNIIAEKYPKLWNYLMLHSKYLDKRKSAIYKKRPRFSIFGIGDYAFKPYKIAISGFYKQPNFSLIFPIVEKPVMLDDTCYYLYFDSFQMALYTWILLNLHLTKEFLSSIVFLDSKRPYTKEVLMRINLIKLANFTEFEDLSNYFQQNLKENLDYPLTEAEYASYIKKIES